MAVMLSSRNLRNAPSLDPTALITPAVIVPAGKKVQVVDNTNASLLHISFMDGDKEQDGWVSALAVDQTTDAIGGPLDKLVFAEACVRRAVSWGVSAHYLMSVAEMRTRITDGPGANGIDDGPFALSPSEWGFYTALPDYDLGMTAADIANWRSQCSVFSVMILNVLQKLSALIGDQPTYSELLLAQVIGATAAGSAIKNSSQTVDSLIAAVPAGNLQAEGIDGTRIMNRYPALVGGGATASVALQRIDTALQQALDGTRDFILKVAGQTIDTSPSDSKPPAVTTPTAVTPAIVSKMFGGTKIENITKNLPFVVDGLRGLKLGDKQMLNMALSTIRVETAGFVPISEGQSVFNTTASPFDKYDPGTKIGHNLGNTQPGDGSRFKGRGYVQITGRFNYKQIGDQIGSNLVANPELANDPAAAGKILAQFLKNKEAAIRAALRANDLTDARILVNGGTHGLTEFIAAYKIGDQVLPTTGI
jgi:putative chitinase